MEHSGSDPDSGDDPDESPQSRDEDHQSSEQTDGADGSIEGDSWVSVSDADRRPVPEEPASGDDNLPIALGDVAEGSAETDPVPAAPDQLPTYNESIDPTFDSGFVPGSILAVEGPPQSKSDVLVANLISGGNPVVYFSGVRSTEAIKVRLDQLKTIPKDDRHVFDVSGWDVDEFVSVLEELQLGQPSTVVVDPITLVETAADRDSLVAVMRALNETIGKHSLGIVHCVTPAATPSHRWVTLQLADTLFEVRHDPGRESPNLLYINRLHPKQSFGGKGREFDLSGDLDLDLTYDESLSTPSG